MHTDSYISKYDNPIEYIPEHTHCIVKCKQRPTKDKEPRKDNTI